MDVLKKLTPHTVMIFSYFFYTLNEMGIKMMSLSSKPFEIIFLRSALEIVIILILLNSKFFKILKSFHVRDLVLGIVSLSSLFFAVKSLSSLSLPAFSIINLSVPMVVVFIAKVFLREHITIKKIIQLLLGLLGGFIVAFKGNLSMEDGMIYALISAVLNSFSFLILKRSQSERMRIFVSYLLICFFVSPFFINLNEIKVPKLNSDMMWFLLAALAHLAGFFLLISAVQREKLSKLVHLEYTTIIFSMLLSLIFLSIYPTYQEIFGAFLIFLSMLIETKRNHSDGNYT